MVGTEVYDTEIIRYCTSSIGHSFIPLYVIYYHWLFLCHLPFVAFLADHQCCLSCASDLSFIPPPHDKPKEH